MKNKFKKSLVIVLVVIAVTIGGYIQTSQVSLSASFLMMENIEALASSEISMDFCMVVPGVCIIYSDGLAIKGFLQYSASV